MKQRLYCLIIFREYNKGLLDTGIREKLPNCTLFKKSGIEIETVVKKKDKIIHNYLDRYYHDYERKNIGSVFDDFDKAFWEFTYTTSDDTSGPNNPFAYDKKINPLFEDAIVECSEGLAAGGILHFPIEGEKSLYYWQLVLFFKGKVFERGEADFLVQEPEREIGYLKWKRNKNPSYNSDYTIMQLKYG